MANAPEVPVNRHKDCTWATERDKGDGSIFCWWHMQKYAANELTKCGDFRAPRLRALINRAEGSYGRLKGPRLAVTRIGK